MPLGSDVTAYWSSIIEKVQRSIRSEKVEKISAGFEKRVSQYLERLHAYPQKGLNYVPGMKSVPCSHATPVAMLHGEFA